MAIKDKKEASTREDEVKLPSRGRSGRAPSNDGKVKLRDVSPKKVDYSKTSDDDIFEGRVKLKG